MKTKIFFALAMTVACAVNAQDFNAEFTKAQRDADTLKQKEILASWENSNDRSAEFFLAKADYWSHRQCKINRTRQLIYLHGKTQ